MIWFAIIAAALLAALFVWWVIAFSRRNVHPFIWQAALSTALVVGLYPSYWISFRSRYALSDSVEVQGFPLPVKFFVRDEFHWEEQDRSSNDFQDGCIGSLNVFLNVTLFFLPIAVGMFIVMRRSSAVSQQTDRSRTME